MSELPVTKNLPIEYRFWEKVARGGPDECWLWQAYVCPSTGYGRFGTGDGRVTGAHRYSYELHYGPLAAGMLVRHTCDNTRCVNPKHLISGTSFDNSQDMVRRGRSSKGEGHFNSRLTEEKVLAIRNRYAAGETAEALAAEFGVSRPHLNGVASGKFWRHSPGPRTSYRFENMRHPH